MIKQILLFFKKKFSFQISCLNTENTITIRTRGSHQQQVGKPKIRFRATDRCVFLGRPLERHWSGSWAWPSLLYSFALYTDTTTTYYHCSSTVHTHPLWGALLLKNNSQVAFVLLTYFSFQTWLMGGAQFQIKWCKIEMQIDK